MPALFTYGWSAHYYLGQTNRRVCCIRFGLGNARLRLYWRVTERNRKARRNSAILRYCPRASTEATNPKGPLRESPRKPRTGRKANTNRVVKRQSRPEAERIRPDMQIAPHVGRCLECDCAVVAFGQCGVSRNTHSKSNQGGQCSGKRTRPHQMFEETTITDPACHVDYRGSLRSSSKRLPNNPSSSGVRLGLVSLGSIRIRPKNSRA